MNPNLWETVEEKLVQSDVAGANRFLEESLGAEPHRCFKGLIGASFSNSPQSILRCINDFITVSQAQCDIKAVYLEMNGFSINYPRWYFDRFGYTKYEPAIDDLEWLCDWESIDAPQVVLTGLELVQEDYRWYHENEIWKDKSYKVACDAADLLVMTKFVALIETAVQSGNLVKSIPVVATAHDFDIVGRFAV